MSGQERRIAALETALADCDLDREAGLHKINALKAEVERLRGAAHGVILNDEIRRRFPQMEALMNLAKAAAVLRPSGCEPVRRSAQKILREMAGSTGTAAVRHRPSRSNPKNHEPKR